MTHTEKSKSVIAALRKMYVGYESTRSGIGLFIDASMSREYFFIPGTGGREMVLTSAQGSFISLFIF